MKTSKRKIIFIAFFVIVTITVPFFANSNPDQQDSIYLSGTVGAKANIPEGSTFSVNLITNNAHFTWSSFIKSYKVKVQKGKFRLALLPENHLTYAYFNLELPNNTRHLMNEGNVGNLPYLLEKGDQIRMEIFKLNQLGDYIVFSGKGAAKINCQQQLYQAKNYLPSGAFQRYGQLLNDTDLSTLKPASKFFEQHLNMKLAILDSYKDSISSSIYELIYYDCIGLRLIGELKGLNGIKRNINDPQDRFVIEKYLQEIQPKNLPESKSLHTLNSIFFGRALFELERYRSKRVSINMNNDFGPIYNAIRKRYVPGIRDDLWLNAVLELAQYSKNTIDYLDTIMAQMEDNQSRKILKEWKRINSGGAKAYDFKLSDEKNKVFTLKDFRGKMIVADFWFTGCAPCRGMAKLMSPIAKHFKYSDKIIFLSINVDAEWNQWKKGLDEGTYVFPGSVHLWTMGEGMNSNPFLKHYNFNSFPKLLIIDSEGYLISSSPPHPGLDNGAGLINLIKNNLN